MTRRLRTLLLLIAMLAGVPATVLGQVSITELGAANAGQTVSYGMKYTLSYALAGLLLALGMYLVCRPSNRNAVE